MANTNLRQVTTEALTAVADKIREKGSTASLLYWPDGFIQAINDISGGGDINWKNEFTDFLAGTASQIPDIVQNLRDYALYNFAGITNAMVAGLPDGLETLGDYCLAANPSLTEIDLSSKSLTSLGAYCFNLCTGVTKIDLSDNDITILGDYICSQLASLTTIDLSGNPHLTDIPAYFANKAASNARLANFDITGTPIETVGAYAFYSARPTDRSPYKWLETCTTLKEIGAYAFFSQDGVHNYTLDLSGATSLEIIGENAFTSNPSGGTKGFTSIKFPASLVTIGANAFYKNPATSIDFTGCVNLETIGASAFVTATGANVAHLDLSDCTSLDTIGANCFYGNSNFIHRVNKITFPSHKITSIGNSAFRQAVLSGQGELTVKTSALGQDCFRQNTGITKLNLAFDSTGTGAFYGCTGITEVHILNTPTSFPSNIATYPVFYGCTAVTDIYVPWSAGDIPENRFFRAQDASPTWHYNTV